MIISLRLESTLGSISSLHYRSLQFRHPTFHLAQRLGGQIVSALIKISPFFREQKEDIIGFLLVREWSFQAVSELGQVDHSPRCPPGARVVVEFVFMQHEIFRLPGWVLQQFSLRQPPEVSPPGAGGEGGDAREGQG